MMTSMPAKIRIETAWSDSTRASAGLEPGAEKTRRAHQEDHDHHRERERVPVGRRKIRDAQHLDDTDDETADHRAGDVPEAAEQYDGEPLEPDLDAEDGAKAGEFPGEEHAGGAAGGGADGEGGNDGNGNVDASRPA